MIKIKTKAPYNFFRSLKVNESFSHSNAQAMSCLRVGFRYHNLPLVMTLCAAQDMSTGLTITSSGRVLPKDLVTLARWVLFEEFDLVPFYQMTQPHPVLGPIVQKLWGVKPMRPASLFEMAITVITEQQISLTAANRIRSRLMEHFGDQVEGLWVFPNALTLAESTLDAITDCGYSHRKAEYIQDFSRRVVDGALDLEVLKLMQAAQVYQELIGLRGWGPWSVNYFLIRGLSHPDAVPVEDIAIRTVVGKYLGKGERVGADHMESLLEPFRPFRGMIFFYLLAYDRRIQSRLGA